MKYFLSTAFPKKNFFLKQFICLKKPKKVSNLFNKNKNWLYPHFVKKKTFYSEKRQRKLKKKQK
jgi:hypothetical protein